MKNILLSLFAISIFVNAQDSVDVTFRYNASSTPTVFVVGEFNGWNNGAMPMQYTSANQWERIVRLPLGGNPNPPAVGVPGAWQYKFYYAGVGQWPNDPLNHKQNEKDNLNTYIFTKDPTIYHLLPNQRQSIVLTGSPVISAFLFPKVGATIDTSSIIVTVDGTAFSHIGRYYDAASKKLTFPFPNSLSNGSHTVILSVSSSASATNADTVSFTTQAGFVQITSQGGYPTRSSLRTLRGVVQNNSVSVVKIVRNLSDTTSVPVTSGSFIATDTLTDGVNTFKAVVDTGGITVASDPVTYTFVVNHSPYAKASVSFSSGSTITLSAAGSTHPDAKAMTYKWQDDIAVPLGLNGKTAETVEITKPLQAGEYYYSLIATDKDGAADTARFYFTIKKDGTYENPAIASNPQWAKQARVYFLFPKSFTAQGTISAAAQRLQYIKELGFSVIWMMPVMKNAYPIDQNYGPGYNITDFYNVASEYGTNQDFKNFISQAHTLGIKVILDVTPNHTSRFHPWSLDAHLFKQDSRYWNWYEHTTIVHNTNGLGQSFDADGFNYYSGFSDQLLNYNWTDIDARTEMINVYKYWIKEFGLDGYRFDVYWGPHRRYGEQYMGIPMRAALKHIKPDIFLLAEDDGTGSGTETIYADYATGGGVDASYDFKSYFNQIRGFGFNALAVDNLHNELNNGGFYPGPNSLYMRFMESQDEDRISYFYSNSNSLDATTTFNRSKPMASVIFSVPGFPMIWNGQEVGWGYGISGSKEARNRSTISWEYQGKPILTPHYQRLAWIRGAFAAFATQAFFRIGTNDGAVYGILRPYYNDNAITLANITEQQRTVTLNLSISGTPSLLFSNPTDGKTYFVNDVYNDSTYEIKFTGGLANFSMNVPAFGTAVLIVSDSVRKVTVPKFTSVHQIASAVIPEKYSLSQNYPNPFNPTTTIRYQLIANSFVSLKVFDIVGREMVKLVNERQEAGTYQTSFDAQRLPSGLYFYQLRAGSFTETKKMMLVK
jgi:glycosidase